MLLSTVVALLQLSAVMQPDDGKLHRDARKAQARFETVRRMHLPWTRSGSSSSRCDTEIGRYCYWYDSTLADVVPEPARISQARTALLRLLDSAAAVNATDGWITGQRVRYLIEGGRADDATSVARSCGADSWWCFALEGLALHVAERYSEADSVYAVVLRKMPSQQRCEWLDLSNLTDGAVSREFGAASCDEREALADRLWELSRPLWSVPGNDMRTEHFSRHTMAAILARSANAHGMVWGDDSRELLLRYGWAEWFTRERADMPGIYASPRVTGHDREPSYHFFPAVASARVAPTLTETTWRLRDPLAPSRYAPRHLKRLIDLPHQLNQFPRGDSMLVVVAYRIDDAELARDSLSIFLCHSERDVQHPLTRVPARVACPEHVQIPRFARDDWGGARDDSRTGVLYAMTARESMIASIEVRGETTNRVARARYSVDPLSCSSSWCVSDLLLFDASRARTTDTSAMPRALAELSFTNRTSLGVFWEIQGVGITDVPVWLSLTVAPVRVSLARRVATKLHLARELAPVRVRWQQTLTAARDDHRVTLRLPRNARGRYRVVLTVEPPNSSPLVATRDIELLP